MRHHSIVCWCIITMNVVIAFYTIAWWWCSRFLCHVGRRVEDPALSGRRPSCSECAAPVRKLRRRRTEQQRPRLWLLRPSICSVSNRVRSWLVLFSWFVLCLTLELVCMLLHVNFYASCVMYVVSWRYFRWSFLCMTARRSPRRQRWCESAVSAGGVDNSNGAAQRNLGRPPQVCFRFFMLLEPQFLCHGFLCFDSI
jgi:hypothetical protein